MTIISSVKGTRDFYPADMPFRNWFLEKIKDVSARYGYEEFDGPSIEYLDLYSDKSSAEILSEQSFLLNDRDGKKLILRPEVTPTMARMVAARSTQLTQPIRWWSFGRAWRYEKPQKGRTREFFQWEINLLGPESPVADAEMLALAADFFRALGLTSDEVVIKVSDRSYFEQYLLQNDISKDLKMPILRIIDKADKLPRVEIFSLLNELNLTKVQSNAVIEFLDKKDFSDSSWLSQVFGYLENYGELAKYVVFDPTIARGFDYYTRTVFEAWDKTGNLNRALFGGGRFDNLTEKVGGARVPGVGMAPGDVPIEALLSVLGKIPQFSPNSSKVLVSVFDESTIDASLSLATKLREWSIDVMRWPDTTTKFDKQLKFAISKNISYFIILGPDEIKDNLITIKNLQTREQSSIAQSNLSSKLFD